MNLLRTTNFTNFTNWLAQTGFYELRISRISRIGLRRQAFTNTNLTNLTNLTKKNRMRWELETTWETENRMVLWVNNQYAADTTAAAIRLKRTKGKESKQAKVSEQQQLAAQVRQQQDEAERRKDEEAKANRMDSRDYVKNNPNGYLAKLQREEENKKSNPKNHK